MRDLRFLRAQTGMGDRRGANLSKRLSSRHAQQWHQGLQLV
jgi:hypothetical protein